MASESEKTHQIDEERGWVVLPAVLAGGIIRRKDVVVVVVSLTAGTESHAKVLGRIDASVVRPVAPEMSDTVDGPRDVKYSDVAEDTAREESRPRRLTPVVNWYDGRNHETQQNHRRHVHPTHQHTLVYWPSLLAVQLSGRTSVSDRRTFTGLHPTCSWWVTIYMGKPSAVSQQGQLNSSSFRGR